ncbi:hypothetical protein CAEBREN_03002 [Caenorhabditis brenneri]|uniref:Uncharacterized protein n=1 Tax=Caenorhabditis brenneri TaxID=135651 RepID=G0NGV7_CAEBE|nr:hypothetical protein CAEBREN_03002 [Caenorhabditis brenneri]
MEEELYNGFYPNRQIYYTTAYPYRSPFALNRPYLEDDYTDYYRDYLTKTNSNFAIRDYERKIRVFDFSIYYIRVLSYAQIFLAGILLVTDVSKNVLLWNYIQMNGVKIEMLAHVIFPIFALIVGFICLTAILNPSKALSKSVAILLLVIIVPNFIFPKYSVFMTNAIESVEISQVMDRNLFGKDIDMIKSETHNRMSKILMLSTNHWPLGVSDLTSLPTDFVLMMQYLLIAYSVFSLSLFIFYVITLFCFVRLLSVQ